MAAAQEIDIVNDDNWQPDNLDGSGWADVDWASAARGSRYHYRHVGRSDIEWNSRPRFYRIVTRLDTAGLAAPHENSYFVPSDKLADFVMELSLSGGNECIWHIEPYPSPPPEAMVDR